MKEKHLNQNFGFILILIIIGITFLAGCAQEGGDNLDFEFVVTPEEDNSSQLSTPVQENLGDSYPSQQPGTSLQDNAAYPGQSGSDAFNHSISTGGRTHSAIESYSLAYSAAVKDFDENAYLSAIAPSHIMLVNLGNPPVLPGWFYKFRKLDSRREFIVQIVDEVITGTTLTESTEDVSPQEQPISIDSIVFDNDDVLTRFIEVGTQRGVWSEDINYDFELVYLVGTSSPVWSVVDPISQEWLFSMDALTGEEVNNPYQQ